MRILQFISLFLLVIVIHTVLPDRILYTKYGKCIGRKLFGKDIMESVYNEEKG